MRLAVGESNECLELRWQAMPGQPTVVYLHGMGSSQDGDKAEFFRRVLVSANYGFCSFDMRGHGRSDGLMVDLSLSRSIEDLSTVIDFLQQQTSTSPSPLFLMGSSFGGLTALWCARNAKPQVRRHLLGSVHIAPAIGLDTLISEQLGREGVSHWREAGVLEVPTELGSLELGYGFYEDLAKYRSEDLARGYDLPSLIFQGAQDETVPWRPVADFVSSAQKVEMVLFSDGDHRLLDLKERLGRQANSFFMSRVSAEG